MAIFRRGPPLNVASNAGGVGTNPDSGRIAGYRSMTSAVRATPVTVDGAVYRTDGDASVNLCLSQPVWSITTKTRKQNSIYLYAAVNLKRKLRSMYCTIEATDRHEASRGLSATAVLLVCISFHVLAGVFVTSSIDWTNVTWSTGGRLVVII